MVFTKEEKEIIKILVAKEIAHFKKDIKKLMLVNAEYLTKSAAVSEDLSFLKVEAQYKSKLESLLKKI
ncbi:hypothetical protein HOA92_06620 [archaeon]|jgi:hypothetical protein|nr:hypothetical protein [archaeon]MBT6762685.1 hypothetical protein [archaeon]